MFQRGAVARTIILPLAIAVVVSGLYAVGLLEKVELITVDARYRFLPPPSDVPATLVAIDQNSLKEIGVWPWPRYLYAQLIDILEKAGARSLLMDLDFSSRSIDLKGDQLFVKAAGSKMPVYLAMHMEDKVNDAGFRILNASLPFPELLEASAGAASIVFKVDDDDTVRSMPEILTFGDSRFMPLGAVAAATLDRSVQYDPPEGALINISDQFLDAVNVLHFLDVLSGRFDRADIQGKAVFVGATAQDLRDFWSTPLGILPGVYLHAAVMDTLLDRTWITRNSPATTVLLVFTLSLALGTVLGRAGWKLGAITLIGYLGLLGVVVLTMIQFSVMLEVVPLALAAALQYPVQVALQARSTERVLDLERRRSDAILKMSELEDAEETGQEPYVVPLVLLRQVLGLEMVKLFLLTGDDGDTWLEDALLGEGDHQHDAQLLTEAVERGELINIRGDGATMCSYVPLRTVRRPMGALFVVGTEGYQATENEQRMLLSYATQTAYFLESRELARQMKDEEAVRTNLARYLSPQIVEQVIEEKVQVNLGGHRKVVTALFSDIRKFTTISESLPPDMLVSLLNEYFNEMANIIFHHQGSLDKYIGDALIAVYGSLIALENPVKNCVDSAIAMMKIMSKLNWKWSNRYDGFTMDVGIGINTGEVFVGNIGSVERMEFTVIGDAVNVASRFSDLANPGQILITEPAFRQVEGLFDIEELEPVQVKGKSGRLRVFEVVY